VTIFLYAVTGRAIHRGKGRNKLIPNELNDIGIDWYTTHDVARECSVAEDNLSQVYMHTETQQTSELAPGLPSHPTVASVWTVISEAEDLFTTSERSSKSIGQPNMKFERNSSVTTIAASATAAKVDTEASPLGPRHIPIIVPAFGNGMIKPLSIPLDQIPPHSRPLRLDGLLSSSFSTTSTRGRRDRASSRSNALTYARVAFALFIIMLVIWVPSTVNRVYQLIRVSSASHAVSVALNYAAACVLPLQGFFNAAIYLFIGRRDMTLGWKSFWAKSFCIFQKRSRDFSPNEPASIESGQSASLEMDLGHANRSPRYAVKQEPSALGWPLTVDRNNS
jgi:hypothetical protein